MTVLSSIALFWDANVAREDVIGTTFSFSACPRMKLRSQLKLQWREESVSHSTPKLVIGAARRVSILIRGKKQTKTEMLQQMKRFKSFESKLNCHLTRIRIKWDLLMMLIWLLCHLNNVFRCKLQCPQNFIVGNRHVTRRCRCSNRQDVSARLRKHNLYHFNVILLYISS